MSAYDAEAAERALLGLFILQPERIWSVQLGSDDWSSEAHREIYEALVEMAVAGGGVDLPSLAHQLASRGTLSTVGGIGYLSTLTSEAGVNALELGAIIREAARRRTLARAARLLSDVARNPSADMTEAMQAIDLALDAISEQAATEIEPLHVVVEQRVEEIARREGPAAVVPTGFTDLDRRIGGLPRGELSVLAARPSMGKSALAHQIALNVARRGDPVLLCSPEMSRRAVADRFLALLSRRNLSAISAGMVSAEALGDLRRAAEFVPVGITVYDAGIMTTADILAAARAQHARGGLALLIVDHLQYLADRPERGESRVQLIGRMAKALKGLARRLGCAVLLLSQLSRATEQREDKRPALSDLRDSGEIEQDADLVLLLYREHAYRKTANPRDAELIIAKQRNGPTGSVRLDWQPEVVTFGQRANREATA